MTDHLQSQKQYERAKKIYYARKNVIAALMFIVFMGLVSTQIFYLG